MCDEAFCCEVSHSDLFVTAKCVRNRPTHCAAAITGLGVVVQPQLRLVRHLTALAAFELCVSGGDFDSSGFACDIESLDRCKAFRFGLRRIVGTRPDRRNQ